MDAVATGVGPSRPEAREAACKLIAEKLEIGKRKKANRPSAPEKSLEKKTSVRQENQPSKAANSTKSKAKAQKKHHTKKVNKPTAKV